MIKNWKLKFRRKNVIQFQIIEQTFIRLISSIKVLVTFTQLVYSIWTEEEAEPNNYIKFEKDWKLLRLGNIKVLVWGCFYLGKVYV